MCDDFACVVEDAAVAIEDEFIVTADLVDVDEWEVMFFGSVGEEFLSEVVFVDDEG